MRYEQRKRNYPKGRCPQAVSRGPGSSSDSGGKDLSRGWKNPRGGSKGLWGTPKSDQLLSEALPPRGLGDLKGQKERAAEGREAEGLAVGGDQESHTGSMSGSVEDALCIMDEGGCGAAHREEVWGEAIGMDGRAVFEAVGLYAAEAFEVGL